MKRAGSLARRAARLLPLGVLVVAGSAWSASATMPLTTQDPASAQPTLPRQMPDLVVPTGQASTPRRSGDSNRSHHLASRNRVHRNSDTGKFGSVRRPALATVELTERLLYPPQPPHVSVPVPAYPLENFVTAFTTPPPPVICRPTRRDPFQPDAHLPGEQPVLCTADNP